MYVGNGNCFYTKLFSRVTSAQYFIIIYEHNILSNNGNV